MLDVVCRNQNSRPCAQMRSMLSPLVSSASGELKSLADGSPQTSRSPTDGTATPGGP